MLSRRISRSFHLLLRQKASFGGGHGHDHDHGHNYHVTVDKKSTWIKYNSVIFPSKRIRNLSLSTEWKTPIKNCLLVKIATPSNTFVIPHSFPIIGWSIMIHGSTRIPTNLTTLVLREGTWTDRTLSRADSFIRTQSLWVYRSRSLRGSWCPSEIWSYRIQKRAFTTKK
jgi:hypothetical protein